MKQQGPAAPLGLWSQSDRASRMVSSLIVPEGGEQGSPGVAARFHQESSSSGKVMVMCRPRAKLGEQVRIRSGDGYHKEKAQKSPGRYIVAKSAVAGHRDAPWQSYRHITNPTKKKVPGLSLNEGPKPMGWGCGWRSQVRLIKVIKAHYWPQSPVTETQMILCAGSRWSCWGSRKTVTWFASKISKGTAAWMKTVPFFSDSEQRWEVHVLPKLCQLYWNANEFWACSLFCKG